MAEEGVTVVVRRRVKPGAEAEFEAAMQQFIRFALAFPGNRGIDVLRPDAGTPGQYTVVDHFADRRARQGFKSSPDYKQWMQRLRELTESEPYIEEQGGLGGWFTPPSASSPAMPARIRMAAVTFLGVLPLTAGLPPLAAWLLPSWHPQAANVLVTAAIVAALTWVVMPLLTRLFAAWLFGRHS